MEKIRPRTERKEPPRAKKEPLLAKISSFKDRKPHRADKPSPLEGRKKKSNPLGGKIKLIVAAIGIILLAAIVVLAANATYKAVAGKPVATPTPEPTAAPEPTPEATEMPTPEPTPIPTAAPGPVTSTDGPFTLYASLNSADGKCLVSFKLPRGAEPIEMSKVSIDISSDGNMYQGVWKPKLMDWCGADNDTLLEGEEIVAPMIDTQSKGIPQGKPLTLVVMNEGSEVQRLTVAPA